MRRTAIAKPGRCAEMRGHEAWERDRGVYAPRSLGLPQQLLTFVFADPYERQEAAEIWSSERHPPLRQMGSWGRYRDALALAWAIIAG